MIPVKTPRFLKRLMPQCIWEINTLEKDIYLTFDDGPEPGATPEVLALLHKYNAQATFFCLGKKSVLYPELVSELRKNGHTIGNHGYNHISGFTTPNKEYFENFEKGTHVLNSNIYRPPYGRITPKQLKYILPHSKVFMWGIMSKDYSNGINPGTCAQNVLKYSYPGAIVVFHDTLKASKNLLVALPEILETLKENGYNFKTLY